jgi:hypothetical protein
MRVINPTDSIIEVTISGKRYVLPANGEISGVRVEHALYWKSRLHNFIIVQEEKEEEKDATDESEVKEHVSKKKK